MTKAELVDAVATGLDGLTKASSRVASTAYRVRRLADQRAERVWFEWRTAMAR